jgi:two-component system, NarL family, response regulator DesR
MRQAPIKVLLADDDVAFLQSLRELIDSQPELSVVASAHNGVEALELADAAEVHAAVVDLHMPQLDGVGTVARLRSDHPELCLIVLTGDPDEQLHRDALDAGADAVLQKHELAQALLDRLAQLGGNGEGRT